jgi:hypothetical protein
VLPYDDDRWNKIHGGYKTLYNPTNALKKLESGSDIASAWNELWEELHHQGDIGEASYAVVPHLVRIQKEHSSLGWRFYSLVSIIEIERHRKSNPPLPDWIESSYMQAWTQLLDLSLNDLKHAEDPLFIQSAIGVLAIAKGLLKLGAIISEFDESELIELLDRQLSWSELYR